MVLRKRHEDGTFSSSPLPTVMDAAVAAPPGGTLVDGIGTLVDGLSSAIRGCCIPTSGVPTKPGFS